MGPTQSFRMLRDTCLDDRAQGGAQAQRPHKHILLSHTRTLSLSLRLSLLRAQGEEDGSSGQYKTAGSRGSPGPREQGRRSLQGSKEREVG
ncbi:hypothetical protein GUJ93_ZPchr0010g9889 [Zizania palustris]|uniref:Uncharacterized protein n=1 Tax=Zizania palustris TaxID=103762 RepID=A0A8J6BL11_ZIZPA|nr:hypothetical protein GUJ93_ZPchr0010g9889 [Zizania palustris]